MPVLQSSENDSPLPKSQRILILLLIGATVFSFQFILFYLFQIVFPYVAFLGLWSVIMAVLVFFSKGNETKIVAVYTPRQINMQIILTSLFFLIVGFVLLYISQFLNDWKLTKNRRIK